MAPPMEWLMGNNDLMEALFDLLDIHSFTRMGQVCKDYLAKRNAVSHDVLTQFSAFLSDDPYYRYSHYDYRFEKDSDTIYRTEYGLLLVRKECVERFFSACTSRELDNLVFCKLKADGIISHEFLVACQWKLPALALMG